MNLLITGGLGFIGSNFIRLILEKYPDFEIWNLDAMTYAGNPENLHDYVNHSCYHFVKGSICNYELVDYLLSEYNIEAIINFAAESHVDRSISNPDVFVDTNVKGTLTLLNAFKKYRHQVKKYVQISTDEVYGDLAGCDDLFREDTSYDPSSPYAATKAGSDHLVRAWGRT
ncbi:MAG: dTDP-glucose 4,6-dehydratase, partial [Promethearchaeia archaeon]